MTAAHDKAAARVEKSVPQRCHVTPLTTKNARQIKPFLVAPNGNRTRESWSRPLPSNTGNALPDGFSRFESRLIPSNPGEFLRNPLDDR